MGTYENLVEASTFIRTIEQRQLGLPASHAQASQAVLSSWQDLKATKPTVVNSWEGFHGGVASGKQAQYTESQRRQRNRQFDGSAQPVLRSTLHRSLGCALCRHALRVGSGMNEFQKDGSTIAESLLRVYSQPDRTLAAAS
jgi:hypothetical protein